MHFYINTVFKLRNDEEDICLVDFNVRHFVDASTGDQFGIEYADLSDRMLCDCV